MNVLITHGFRLDPRLFRHENSRVLIDVRQRFNERQVKWVFLTGARRCVLPSDFFGPFAFTGHRVNNLVKIKFLMYLALL